MTSDENNAPQQGAVLAVVEHSDGKLTRASLEVIAAAQKWAEALQAPAEAVLVGAPDVELGAELSRYQLRAVLQGRHEALRSYAYDVYTQALQQLITATQPVLVLFPHSYRTRDFAPRLATRAGRALISDVIAMRVEQGKPVFTRPIFQGKFAADVAATGGAPYFVSLQIGAFQEPPRLGEQPAPVRDVAVDPEPSRIKSEAPFHEAQQTVDLAQAARIVAVGRGLKEAKYMELAQQLASVLHAELGASRPVCDSGWLPMDRQIGSSGQTVSPKLYVALGISGAIQHLVGMKSARTIIAINKDPEAPIFEVADYGVVGNLFEVVPALLEELKKPS